MNFDNYQEWALSLAILIAIIVLLIIIIGLLEPIVCSRLLECNIE